MAAGIETLRAPGGKKGTYAQLTATAEKRCATASMQRPTEHNIPFKAHQHRGPCGASSSGAGRVRNFTDAQKLANDERVQASSTPPCWMQGVYLAPSLLRGRLRVARAHEEGRRGHAGGGAQGDEEGGEDRLIRRAACAQWSVGARRSAAIRAARVRISCQGALMRTASALHASASFWFASLLSAASSVCRASSTATGRDAVEIADVGRVGLVEGARHVERVARCLADAREVTERGVQRLADLVAARAQLKYRTSTAESSTAVQIAMLPVGQVPARMPWGPW